MSRVGPELLRSNCSGLYGKSASPALALRILVAERTGALLRSLTGAQGAEGFELLSADDGQEALDIACSQLPDLILCEVDLPHLNGIELCRAIRENVWLKRIPVVLLTSRGDREMLTMATRSGANFCLPSPVEPAQLVDLVRALSN